MEAHLKTAFEYLIAADILTLIIHPTFEEIALLASIVVIRTMVSYFLKKEIGDFYAGKYSVGYRTYS